MKEKDLDQKTHQEETKLEWTAPKLFILNKWATNGGGGEPTAEDSSYPPSFS